jgi:hypothetical protein
MPKDERQVLPDPQRCSPAGPGAGRRVDTIGRLTASMPTRTVGAPRHVAHHRRKPPPPPRGGRAARDPRRECGRRVGGLRPRPQTHATLATFAATFVTTSARLSMRLDHALKPGALTTASLPSSRSRPTPHGARAARRTGTSVLMISGLVEAVRAFPLRSARSRWLRCTSWRGGRRPGTRRPGTRRPGTRRPEANGDAASDGRLLNRSPIGTWNEVWCRGRGRRDRVRCCARRRRTQAPGRRQAERHCRSDGIWMPCWRMTAAT